MSNYQSRNLFI